MDSRKLDDFSTADADVIVIAEIQAHRKTEPRPSIASSIRSSW